MELDTTSCLKWGAVMTALAVMQVLEFIAGTCFTGAAAHVLTAM